MQHTAHRHTPLKTDGFAHPARNVAHFGVQTGMNIADFGAGSGAYTLAIASLLEGTGKVYAIDVQRDLLRRIHNEAAKRSLKNVEVIWADLETPRASKLADSSVDLVIISNLFVQVPDKELVLQEARRIVRSSGSVIIIDWSESFGGMGPIKEEVFKKDSAIETARKSGLGSLREFAAGAHHYGLIVRPTPTA